MWIEFADSEQLRFFKEVNLNSEKVFVNNDAVTLEFKLA